MGIRKSSTPVMRKGLSMNDPWKELHDNVERFKEEELKLILPGINRLNNAIAKVIRAISCRKSK